MISLSIIIVSYNTAELTKKCVESVVKSLSKASFESEIIIWDNGSIDNTKQEISDLKQKIKNKKIYLKYFFNHKNLGFAKGNNKAVEQAQGKYLLFLNTDIEVINDSIQKLYYYFISQKEFQFVGAKLFEKDGVTPQSSCGPAYNLKNAFISLFLRGDYLKITRYSPNSIKNVDWVSGACFICEKKIFYKLEGFDENIFMYMDEIELFLRAKKKGYKIGFYPFAHFIHIGSASSSSRKNPIIQVYKGYIYLYKKHYGKKDLKILLFMLKLKAKVAYLIGKIFRNEYLKKTYGEALEICKNN